MLHCWAARENNMCARMHAHTQTLGEHRCKLAHTHTLYTDTPPQTFEELLQSPNLFLLYLQLPFVFMVESYPSVSLSQEEEK